MVYRIYFLMLGVIFAQTNLQAQDSSFSEQPAILETSNGNIFGSICLPAGTGPFPVALIIAGSGPTDRNGNSMMTRNNGLKMMAETLAGEGIASLRYDKRGIAASMKAMKKEDSLRFDDYVSDAKGWIDFLKKDARFKNISIIGHSEGSLIGMLASEKANKFISLAGPGEQAGKIIRRQLAEQPEQFRKMSYELLDSLEAGRTVTSVSPLLFSLFRPSIQPYMISWFRYDPQAVIAGMNIPVLIIQGTTDLQVTTDDARKLAAANPTASLVIIENMNHVLKMVGTDRNNNIKSYNDPELPVSKEMTTAIISFILNR